MAKLNAVTFPVPASEGAVHFLSSAASPSADPRDDVFTVGSSSFGDIRGAKEPLFSVSMFVFISPTEEGSRYCQLSARGMLLWLWYEAV